MNDKIIQLIKKIFSSKLLKSSISVSASKVIASLFNLAFMILAVNLLVRSDNGKFQYYMGFIPLILAIAEFGIPSAMIKFLSNHLDNKKKIGTILISSLAIKLVAILILVFLGIVSILIFKEDIISVYAVLVGGIVISFISFFESIFISFRYYFSLSIWNPLTNLIRLILLVSCANYFSSPLSYIDILVIFTFSPIFILVLFVFIFPKDKLNWSASSKEDFFSETKNISLFNLWAFIATMLAITSDRLEIFMLHKFHSPNDVAVYGTALQLFSGFVIILSTLNSIVYPRLASQIDKDEFKNTLLKSILVGSMMAFLLVPGFFLAEPILNLLFQNKYQESISVFKILYPNYLLQLVFAPMGIALFAMGKPQILAILAFLRLAVGYILDIQLIPEYGVIGASISFFLGQVISWLVLIGYFFGNFFEVTKDTPS